MTPAITLLESADVEFEVLSYEHDDNETNFGQEAVNKLSLQPEQVFKTLVFATHTQQLVVAITPVNRQVNLKQLAKACGVKKVALADAQKVERSTGYVLGGVSPLGQKRPLSTFLHRSAEQFSNIYVSAGKRGLELKLSPDSLCRLSGASLADF